MKGASLGRRVATVVVVGAGVAFLGVTLRRNWPQVAAYDWQARWGQLLLSGGLLSVSFAWAAYLWKRVLDRFQSAATSYRAVLRISFISRVARFIPGKIWQFVAVGQLSAGSGASARVMVSSMLLQVGFILLSGMVVSAVVLGERVLGGSADAGLAVAGASVLAIAGSHPRVINAGLALVSRVVRRPTLTWTGGWRDSAELMLLSLVLWAIQGVAFYLFADALVRVELGDLLPLTAVNAASFVAGYLAVVAPAGIGVREATMVPLLSAILPTGTAAVVAVASRLWMIVAELLGVGLVLLLVPGPGSQDDAGSRG
jgi:uncharacterized membrane protein YbhN (UPF0104 family)